MSYNLQMSLFIVKLAQPPYTADHVAPPMGQIMERLVLFFVEQTHEKLFI